MNRYKLPDGATVRTSAKRRYLVVGHYAGAKPSVECSFDLAVQADANCVRLAKAYPFTAWFVVDQERAQ